MRAILALLTLTLAVAVQASVPTAAIDEFIATAMPETDTPGLAYAVVEDGTVHAEARGETLLGSGDKVTPDTPFLLGSISKSFTALAVMQLVEAGKVDLDAPISRYLSVFADSPGKAITIRQLLGHTSGYSTLQGNDRDRDANDSADALSRQVAAIAQRVPAQAAGTHWDYSNANYLILGALIETVSGQEYAAYIEAHILRPIGMTHAFVADGAAHAEMARGHLPWFGTKTPLDGAGTDRTTAPAGGIVASANDMAKYLAVMMNGRDDVLSAAGKAQMLRPASDASPYYGFGWGLDPEGGTVYHSGTSPGTETLAQMRPAEKTGVIILINAGSGFGFGENAALMNGIAARALGLDTPAPDGRWGQKATFVTLALLPLLFIGCMLWAWFHRAALRRKTGVAGAFSLWFPLVAMAAMAWVFVWLVPALFGTSPQALWHFAPDLTLALVASAVMGVVWAVWRLALAYGGRATAG
ncbi:serine hydrolase domain-containing protein [Stakelama tenebrarum]|uniref:Beta-lactamase family protein n=1 Tax=Stakelama tenebrarum TaxID=2711215 RepID=A0A6G6Y8E2_9SPHN|nr:serine hydrolase domain-containing protein [Sphingosinithalassobacter tenebrarum]QIG80843.1 beta-lactamase family protein [Sphingosinithalassobacter tenebrarum]